MSLSQIRQRGTKAELARLLLVDKSSVGRWAKTADFPPVDTNGTHDVFDVAEWFFRRKINQELDVALSVSSANSEGLERYRQAKAALAEMELSQARGEIVRLDQFEEIAVAIFTPLRAFGEFLKRTDNHDAIERLEECHKAVLSGLERLYSVEDTDSAT